MSRAFYIRQWYGKKKAAETRRRISELRAKQRQRRKIAQLDAQLVVLRRQLRAAEAAMIDDEPARGKGN